MEERRLLGEILDFYAETRKEYELDPKEEELYQKLLDYFEKTRKPVPQ